MEINKKKKGNLTACVLKVLCCYHSRHPMSNTGSYIHSQPILFCQAQRVSFSVDSYPKGETFFRSGGTRQSLFRGFNKLENKPPPPHTHTHTHTHLKRGERLSSSPVKTEATLLGIVVSVLAVVCKRMQQLQTMLGPAVHRGKDTYL